MTYKRPTPKRTYDYKGFRPYGAGELFVLDAYVDNDFRGNVPEDIMENNNGKWDADKLVMTMPSGVSVQFVKKED